MKRSVDKVLMLAGGLLLAGLAACGDAGCVNLRSPETLLAKPYPEGYPSSRPLANPVVRKLGPGRYESVDQSIGKDYVMYEIRTPDGARGWVEGGPEVSPCE